MEEILLADVKKLRNSCEDEMLPCVEDSEDDIMTIAGSKISLFSCSSMILLLPILDAVEIAEFVGVVVLSTCDEGVW